MINEITIRPIYADTDAEGVVYYARYLEWLEKGRTEYLRDAGYTVNQLKQDGVLFAVRNVNLDYLQPGRYDDDLRVRTSVVESKGSRIVFAQEVVNVQTGQVLVSGQILLITLAVNTFKPRRVPEGLASYLQKEQKN